MFAYHHRLNEDHGQPNRRAVDTPRLFMHTESVFGEERGGARIAVQPDWDSPDVILARKEPRHEDDLEDCDGDFDFEDTGERLDLAGIKDIPRDALLRLLLFLIPPANHSGRRRWRVMQLRTIVLAHMLGIDGVAGKTFEDLSKELDCSRAILSLHSLRIIDSLGIEKARQGKRRVSRENYRQAATASHRARGHRMKQDSAEVVP